MLDPGPNPVPQPNRNALQFRFRWGKTLRFFAIPGSTERTLPKSIVDEKIAQLKKNVEEKESSLQLHKILNNRSLNNDP